MIRIELQVDLHYEVDEHGADFVFNIQAPEASVNSFSPAVDTE